MDLRPITPDYSVAPQILPEDVAAIADAGYKSIMCNRPDGEEFGQPDFASIEAEAQKAGLQVCWVPVGGMGPRPDDVAAFGAALRDMPQPLLAYCRTGTRCTMMWTIAMHGTLSDDDLLRQTTEAGYDMRGLIGQLSSPR
ncbi:MAG: TIGR01244 family sulfur transferase [Roseovarius sp.]